MDALPFDPFGFVGGIIAVSILVPLLTTYQVRMRALRGDND